MKRVNADFRESESGSLAMIVLEGQQPLGVEAHLYYDRLIRQLDDDPKHVQHVQNFWGDPLTARAAQSVDGKAAYVQVNLTGNPGETSGNESVAALRHIVGRTPPPPGDPGLRHWSGGVRFGDEPKWRQDDRHNDVGKPCSHLHHVASRLPFGHHRHSLVGDGRDRTSGGPGIVAFLGHHQLVGLTTFAVNLLVSIGIAAGMDYGIFFTGRYQEARQAGEDRETAFYTTYRGVAPVVLASGLTIAGAVFCLSFTRLPMFRTLGVPCAVGTLVAVAVALTLVPAVITVGSRFRLFDPKRKIKVRGWRRVGTAIVRWPAPILVATLAVALIGLLTLPGFRPSYNDQQYIPKNIAANQGYTAAARHFPQSRMSAPEILLIEADHDLRNSADFLVLNKLAKGVLAVPGVSRVQAITRPQGTPIDHATIPYMLSMQMAGMQQTMQFQKERMNDMRQAADQLAETITIMQRMYGLIEQLTNTTHHMVGETHDMQAITNELRDHIADFEDLFRPIRSYFYWEKHCYDIPICESLRSIFDSLDGVDELSDQAAVSGNRLRSTGRAVTSVSYPVPADDRNHEDHADHDAQHD